MVFATWHQWSHPCGHIGTTWQIWFNLCFLQPTRVHFQNGKLIGSAVFAAQGRVSSGILAPHGKYDWNCTHWCHLTNGLPESTTQTANRSVQPFLHSSRQKSVYFTMGDLFPKIAPSYGGSGPSYNSWFLGPVWAHSQNSIMIGSAVFEQTTTECLYTLQCDAPFPSKLLLPMGDLDPHLIHGSLGPPKSSTQTASQLVQPFCRAH